MIDLETEQWKDMQRRAWNASPCRSIFDAPPWRDGCGGLVLFATEMTELSIRTLFLYTRDDQAFASMGDQTIRVTPERLCKLAAMAMDRASFAPHEF